MGRAAKGQNEYGTKRTRELFEENNFHDLMGGKKLSHQYDGGKQHQDECARI